MDRLFGKISDRMLGLLAPKAEAKANVDVMDHHIEQRGCCDFCICNLCYVGTNTCWCVQCTCSRC